MTSLYFTELAANEELHSRLQSNPWQSIHMGSNPLDYLESAHLPVQRGAVSTSASAGAYSSQAVLENPSATGMSGNAMLTETKKWSTRDMLLAAAVVVGVLYYMKK